MDVTPSPSTYNDPATNFALVAPGRERIGLCSLGAGDGTKRRVLFVSYAFPPTGGGGVQRAVKFAKYLPDFGWRPTIVTVANPSVPLQDPDLARDLHPQTEIVRARTWEPGYGIKRQLRNSGRGGGSTIRGWVRKIGMQLLQPDPQILWNPSAMREAVRRLRTEPHDAIFVTGPPFSSFLLGCKLKKRFGIPLVLDFRDEWLLVSKYMENHQLRGLAYRRQYSMMRKALQAADAIVATTLASAAELSLHCRKVNSVATVSCIYNGFDPDDLQDLPQKATVSPKLRIVYTGTLWKLTDIAPFVSALQSLARFAPQRAAAIELTIAGRRTPEQDTILDRLQGTGVSVIVRDYMPHGQAMRLAASADLLLLLLADQPGAERVVPAKLFEYLALQVPILAMSPEGETSQLLRQHAQSRIFQPNEVEGIARWLDSELNHRVTVPNTTPTSSETPVARTLTHQFSRPVLAGELAHVLHGCLDSVERAG